MSLDRQKEKITDLYNRSVELYKKGNLEEARNGFVEVAKYGLLVTPKGKSPEDYLVLIDKTLTDRLKSGLSAESKPTPTPPAETEKTPTAPQKSETQLSQPSPEPQPSEKPYLEEQPPSSQELAEVAAPAEPTAQAQQPEATTPEAAPVDEAKAKIVRSYTKAVVEDTAVKVGFYIGKGELDKAVNAVRSASDVVSENRPLLGDELFTQYTIRLKRLADRIIQARKSS
jgi:outer membrane biosynthesis protein TonB